MEEQELRKLFEILKSHVGPILWVYRFVSGRSRKNLVSILRNQFDWTRVTEYRIQQIEQHGAEIAFEQFVKICGALQKETIAVLKAAKEREEDSQLPPAELRRQLLEEIEYALWEAKQQSGETP